MFQILLSGKIKNREFNKNPRTQEETAVIELEVSHFRQGEKKVVNYLCTFNPYWTERLKKLPASMKYLTVRGSDIVHQVDFAAPAGSEALNWIKAEEYF
jgi:hypothetical protein